jgi:hypothetical protein
LENKFCINYQGLLYDTIDYFIKLTRGKDARKLWESFPDGMDVLLSHGPPHGILDFNMSAQNVGCEEMRIRLDTMKKPPKLCLFGHIHNSYGVKFPPPYQERESPIYANVALDQTSVGGRILYQEPLSFSLLRTQEGVKIDLWDLHSEMDFRIL